MKVKTLSALAGIGTAMILSGQANAAFTGMTLVQSDSFFSAHPNAAIAAAWNGGPSAALDVYRLYANFDSNTAADRVNVLAGTPATPFTATVVGGTFFNAVDGYGAHFNLPGGVSPAQNAWDTYVTINGLPSGGVASLTPGFGTETNNLGGNGSTFSTMNAAVFIAPSEAQGLAVASAAGQENAPAGVFRVLVAQFTITQGAQMAGSGLLDVNGTQIPIAFATVIPAPGALALLGLAGLVGARRRRA